MTNRLETLERNERNRAHNDARNTESNNNRFAKLEDVVSKLKAQADQTENNLNQAAVNITSRYVTTDVMMAKLNSIRDEINALTAYGATIDGPGPQRVYLNTPEGVKT